MERQELDIDLAGDQQAPEEGSLTMTRLGKYDFVPSVDPCTNYQLLLGDELYR